MTDLEKRADEYADKRARAYNMPKSSFVIPLLKVAYKTGATQETALLSQHILDLQKDKGNLTDEVRKLKILVSSLVYEINQIWDINEMNDDLRRRAEKIDREVQLSKMAEDNRMVISALGFAIVPPKPKLDAEEV